MKLRGFEIVSKYRDQPVKMPERKTSGSSGYDFSALERVEIPAGEIRFVTTGIKAFMPADEVLLMYPRSSLSFKKRLLKANGVGVIDSDYYNNPENEGEIMLILYNFGKETAVIEAGERISQGVFTKYLTADDDDNKIKRLGGFGSTGS